jgi:hypothetical protein
MSDLASGELGRQLTRCFQECREMAGVHREVTPPLGLYFIGD